MAGKPIPPNAVPSVRLTDEQIVEWLIHDLNQQIKRYAGAHPSAHFDIVPSVNFTITASSQITREQLVDLIHERVVIRVKRELLK